MARIVIRRGSLFVQKADSSITDASLGAWMDCMEFVINVYKEEPYGFYKLHAAGLCPSSYKYCPGKSVEAGLSYLDMVRVDFPTLSYAVSHAGSYKAELEITRRLPCGRVSFFEVRTLMGARGLIHARLNDVLFFGEPTVYLWRSNDR